MKGIAFGNWMIRPTKRWQGVKVEKFEMLGDAWTAVKLGYVIVIHCPVSERERGEEDEQ
ncbi:hypothetical protein IQ235_00945 [Oscillatoriales cyanobacterium LEGE 11467]|uniref:Uncharacterized protein n=1 Tax=Zarconia navalis LEGE 11467 TaxID=1828826 RepID=A0A928VVA2_9CYAN|nr:hypothetical protein [Zarconia navalis]MBE9039362.1 hypothetical protein [Zarconia navalis LEGE 11467]